MYMDDDDDENVDMRLVGDGFVPRTRVALQMRGGGNVDSAPRDGRSKGHAQLSASYKGNSSNGSSLSRHARASLSTSTTNGRPHGGNSSCTSNGHSRSTLTATTPDGGGVTTRGCSQDDCSATDAALANAAPPSPHSSTQLSRPTLTIVADVSDEDAELLHRAGLDVLTDEHATALATTAAASSSSAAGVWGTTAALSLASHDDAVNSNSSTTACQDERSSNSNNTATATAAGTSDVAGSARDAQPQQLLLPHYAHDTLPTYSVDESSSLPHHVCVTPIVPIAPPTDEATRKRAADRMHRCFVAPPPAATATAAATTTTSPPAAAAAAEQRVSASTTPTAANNKAAHDKKSTVGDDAHRGKHTRHFTFSFSRKPSAEDLTRSSSTAVLGAASGSRHKDAGEGKRKVGSGQGSRSGSVQQTTPPQPQRTRNAPPPDAAASRLQRQRLAREQIIRIGATRLQQRIDELHFVTHRIKHDGNCQFRAIAHQLLGSEEYGDVIRHHIVSYMRRVRAQYFDHFFESPAAANAYFANLLKPGTWGDELTLRAASDSLYINIHVLSSQERNCYITYRPNADAPPPPAFLVDVAKIRERRRRQRLAVAQQQQLLTSSMLAASPASNANSFDPYAMTASMMPGSQAASLAERGLEAHNYGSGGLAPQHAQPPQQQQYNNSNNGSNTMTTAAAMMSPSSSSSRGAVQAASPSPSLLHQRRASSQLYAIDVDAGIFASGDRSVSEQRIGSTQTTSIAAPAALPRTTTAMSSVASSQALPLLLQPQRTQSNMYTSSEHDNEDGEGNKRAVVAVAGDDNDDDVDIDASEVQRVLQKKLAHTHIVARPPSRLRFGDNNNNNSSMYDMHDAAAATAAANGTVTATPSLSSPMAAGSTSARHRLPPHHASPSLHVHTMDVAATAAAVARGRYESSPLTDVSAPRHDDADGRSVFAAALAAQQQQQEHNNNNNNDASSSRHGHPTHADAARTHEQQQRAMTGECSLEKFVAAGAVIKCSTMGGNNNSSNSNNKDKDAECGFVTVVRHRSGAAHAQQEQQQQQQQQHTPRLLQPAGDVGSGGHVTGRGGSAGSAAAYPIFHTSDEGDVMLLASNSLGATGNRALLQNMAYYGAASSLGAVPGMESAYNSFALGNTTATAVTAAAAAAAAAVAAPPPLLRPGWDEDRTSAATAPLLLRPLHAAGPTAMLQPQRTRAPPPPLLQPGVDGDLSRGASACGGHGSSADDGSGDEGVCFVFEPRHEPIDVFLSYLYPVHYNSLTIVDADGAAERGSDDAHDAVTHDGGDYGHHLPQQPHPQPHHGDVKADHDAHDRHHGKEHNLHHHHHMRNDGSDKQASSYLGETASPSLLLLQSPAGTEHTHSIPAPFLRPTHTPAASLPDLYGA